MRAGGSENIDMNGRTEAARNRRRILIAYSMAHNYVRTIYDYLTAFSLLDGDVGYLHVTCVFLQQLSRRSHEGIVIHRYLVRLVERTRPLEILAPGSIFLDFGGRPREPRLYLEPAHPGEQNGVFPNNILVSGLCAHDPVFDAPF
jgi:hypothetical protein